MTTPTVDPETLRTVAFWFDEEYRLLSMVPRGGRSASTHVIQGRLEILAQSAASLRSWASSGRPPSHFRPHILWEAANRRELREEPDLTPLWKDGIFP